MPNGAVLVPVLSWMYITSFRVPVMQCIQRCGKGRGLGWRLVLSNRRTGRVCRRQITSLPESWGLGYCPTIVSCPASLSHAEKESGETRIQFWFHTYVTSSDTGTMNVIISDGAITVYSRSV